MADSLFYINMIYLWLNREDYLQPWKFPFTSDQLESLAIFDDNFFFSIIGIHT